MKTWPSWKTAWACSGCFSARQIWLWMSRRWENWSPSRWPPESPRHPSLIKSCKNQKEFPQLQGRVYPIRNRFFGETITVSGLVTGQDLIAQLKGQELGQRLLIPSNMLRAGESVFLDDVTVADVERELGVTVCPVDAESGFDLVDAMLGLPVTIEQTTPPGSDGEYYRYNPS